MASAAAVSALLGHGQAPVVNWKLESLTGKVHQDQAGDPQPPDAEVCTATLSPRPGFTEPLAKRAEDLADALGNDHDLAVLRDLLTQFDDRLGDAASAALILPRLDARRADLQGKARMLGGNLYRDRPRDFLARLRAFWKAWRTEVEAARFEEPPAVFP